MLQHFFNACLQVFSFTNTVAGNAKTFCHLHKIRAGNIYKRITFFVKELLPLAHHSEKLVVEN